jgi:RimJ/RimL family protein N-acetyltransferase
LVTDYREIQTERLLMRRWCDSDRAPFAALNADPEVMRYFPAALDRDESDQLIDRIDERFEQQGFGLWALEVLESGEFVGFTGLNPMPDGVPGAGDQEVGWRLDRRAWHKGYATEAARAALDVGLSRLGLPVIWSMTAVINLPSQAVMQRCSAWFAMDTSTIPELRWDMPSDLTLSTGWGSQPAREQRFSTRHLRPSERAPQRHERMSAMMRRSPGRRC